jgi:hypothetical protein
MRAMHAIPLIIAVSFASSSEIPPPVDTPVRLREGRTVDVPFAVNLTGTYDIQLQYPKNAITERSMYSPFQHLVGRATLRAGDKKLEWGLPTGWFRASPFDSIAGGMVLVRFHAFAKTPYVLTLRVTHMPDELERAWGLVSVYKVGPHFHPGHHVYELQ